MSDQNKKLQEQAQFMQNPQNFPQQGQNQMIGMQGQYQDNEEEEEYEEGEDYEEEEDGEEDENVDDWEQIADGQDPISYQQYSPEQIAQFQQEAQRYQEQFMNQQKKMFEEQQKLQQQQNEANQGDQQASTSSGKLRKKLNINSSSFQMKQQEQQQQQQESQNPQVNHENMFQPGQMPFEMFPSNFVNQNGGMPGGPQQPNMFNPQFPFPQNQFMPPMFQPLEQFPPTFPFMQGPQNMMPPFFDPNSPFPPFNMFNGRNVPPFMNPNIRPGQPGSVNFNATGFSKNINPLNKQQGQNADKKKKKEKKDDKKAVVKPKVYKRLLKDSGPEEVIGTQKKTKSRVQKVNLDDLETETDLSKYVAVDESRQPVNIVFIGHVDAGKSTICGNILLLSGKVDQQELRRFEQEAKDKNRDSWYLAYIMDINEEERSKGKTVEVGKAHFTTNTKRFTILDAPGHKNYVPNMIGGAAQADVAALVISAKTGEFESGFEKGGQTQEHAMLAISLGVQFLYVVINKMDEIDWDQKRYDTIIEQLEPFLIKSCGYLKKNICYLPITGLFGDNMKDRVDPKKCPWYKGGSLWEELDNTQIPDRDPNAGLRMPVLDKMRDQGLFVFGKIEQGTIKDNITVTLMPYKQEFMISEIYNTEDVRVMYAKPGENVKLRVKGIEDAEIVKGQMICNVDPCQICFELEAELKILELPEHKPLFSQGYTCVVHIHTCCEEVEITQIVSIYDSDKEKYVKSSFLRNGSTGMVRMQSQNFICLEKFENSPNLGRFTLRDEGRTIALGYVKKIRPHKKEAEVKVNTEQEQLVQQAKEKIAKEKGAQKKIDKKEDDTDNKEKDQK